MTEVLFKSRTFDLQDWNGLDNGGMLLRSVIGCQPTLLLDMFNGAKPQECKASAIPSE
jgi:hypothetical protein